MLPSKAACAWSEAKSTTRSTSDAWFADMLYTPFTEESDKAIIEAVGRIAGDRGMKRAQIALAWLRSKPVVTAPLVGANSIEQIDDAVASLDIALTKDEVQQLEAPYTPRYDFQGISDDADLQAIMAKIPQFTPAS